MVTSASMSFETVDESGGVGVVKTSMFTGVAPVCIFGKVSFRTRFQRLLRGQNVTYGVCIGGVAAGGLAVGGGLGLLQMGWRLGPRPLSMLRSLINIISLDRLHPCMPTSLHFFAASSKLQVESRVLVFSPSPFPFPGLYPSPCHLVV